MVHDFMINDQGNGPVMAMLWQMQHMAFTPDAHAVTVNGLRKGMEQAGFVDIAVDETIPELTHLVRAKKPR